MKKFLQKCKKKIKPILYALLGKDVVYNCNSKEHEKRCLMVYITAPFQTEVSDSHQNNRQALEIARILDEHGYTVDVANYTNPYVILKYKYDLIFGLIPRDIDFYSKCLKPNAKRIAYLTSSNLEYTNQREMERLEAVYQRRGIHLQPRRQGGKIHKVIEDFDGAIFFGNNYNLCSYQNFKMPPVYYVVNNAVPLKFPINYQTKRANCFLYFGSTGQVHKGLDLLLEVFSQPGFPCELYVCGNVSDEPDFEEEYYTELYNTKNIHTYGFVDINSARFEELSSICAYSILPSCAEGIAGSVVTTMSAGMISITSKECGYNDDEVFNLPDCKKETLEKYVLEFAQKDPQWIQNECKRSFEIANERHRMEDFCRSIEVSFQGIGI